MVHLEQRLAQLAVRRVGVERGRARLAVQQDGGEGRAQVAIMAAIGLAQEGAALEGVGHRLDVARRRVGGGEALDEALCEEGGVVAVPEQKVEQSLRLVLRVADGRPEERVELGRVAEGERAAGHAHVGGLVGEVRDTGAVAQDLEDGLVVERTARVLVRVHAHTGGGGRVARGSGALHVLASGEAFGRRGPDAQLLLNLGLGWQRGEVGKDDACLNGCAAHARVKAGGGLAATSV